MKMLREFSIALLLSTGALCAMEEQKALLIKQREALEQECNRLEGLRLSGAPDGALRNHGQALRQKREEIMRVCSALDNLPKTMEKQLQEEYDKKLIDYDKQIALVEAEQRRLGDMAKYDTDLPRRLENLKKVRAQEVRDLEEKKACLSKSPTEIEERSKLQNEKTQILQQLAYITQHTIAGGGPEKMQALSPRLFNQKMDEAAGLKEKLAAINTALLSMNTERK